MGGSVGLDGVYGGRRAGLGLSDETDGTLVDLVGLSQDGGTSLLHDLLLGHLGSFVSEVSVADLRLGGLEVLAVGVEASNRRIEPVFDSTIGRTIVVDRV